MPAERSHLVLIPGLLCTADLFAPQIEALAEVARLTVAEHRGRDSMAAIAEGILAAAPRTFALAGLSMGGYIAFEILRQAPDRVSRLALLDTNARADRPEQIRQRQLAVGLGRALGVRAVQAALLARLLHPFRLADRVLVDRVLAMADATGQRDFERQQTAIMGRPDNRPFIRGLRLPTVIVVGAEDALTPVKVAEEMHRLIAGSRLEVIPDCGHLSTLERPEAVNAILRRWLLD
jgi:pimeloyl-ACP methyl ester carboxylesterase